MNTWRAGCRETCTSGSEGGPEKPTWRKLGRALRSDPYTKLLGPTKWTYYYLYVLLDVFSRYVVGWLLALRESARLAEKLIAESCERQSIAHGQLTVHADRGAAFHTPVIDSRSPSRAPPFPQSWLAGRVGLSI